LACFALTICATGSAHAQTVHGDLMQWHRTELRFTGPSASEADNSPNPFLDFRLQCLFFGPSGQTYDVPGFFDTNAAGGTSGNQWTCRFSPDEAGEWAYTTSFRAGANVAVSLAATPGNSTSFDGTLGAFTIAPSDKAGKDFRAPGHGMLVALGNHYLQFLGSGNAWLKGGPDIPENLLGYTGFDNTPDAGHSFSAHNNDWNNGDPDWNNGDGKAIIGALNYVAGKGANSLYFLPMNIGGDGRDTFPTIAENDKTHFDTSKLAQWEELFTHADKLGVFLHFQLSETETANENYHDNGNLGNQRKLFYRELIARFGHHLGIEWDLGEENDYGTAKREEFAAYIKAIDPYDHPVTHHTRGDQFDTYYGPLLGNGDFDMTAFQTSRNQDALADEVTQWREDSANAGTPWIISIDEPQGIRNDPDDEAQGYPRGRREYLWPTYMAGGGGFEWYVTTTEGQHTFDQAIDDYREMQDALEWTGYALEFMSTLPLLEMDPDNTLSDADYTLASPGWAYAMYNEQGGPVTLDLNGHGGKTFRVAWFNPRSGKWDDGGTVDGGSSVALGDPPFDEDVAVSVINIQDPVFNIFCPTTPTTVCKTAQTGKFATKLTGDKRNKLVWQWKKGEAIALSEFGDVAGGTNYRMCVYDGISGSPELVADYAVPSGPFWKFQKKGAKYSDKHATFDGVKKVQLRAGDPNKTKAQFVVQGIFAQLPVPVSTVAYFEMTPNLQVRLHSSDGLCLGATFPTASKNQIDGFVTKLP
jgi:hypothetical protein